MRCAGSGDGAGFVGWRAACYGPGYVPRGTEYRIYHRVMALRAAVKPLWLGGTRL